MISKMKLLYQTLFLKAQGKDHDLEQYNRSLYPFISIILILLCLIFYLDSAYHINSMIGSEIIISNNMIHHYFDPNFTYNQTYSTSVDNSISQTPLSSSSYDHKKDVLDADIISIDHNNPKIVDDMCMTTIPEVDHGPHIVSPPAGPVTLVCCHTTKGILNIAVHPSWAPLGAANFLNMIKTNYISSKLPLFRVLPGFLIQFGLSSNPEIYRSYRKVHLNGTWLRDDPAWLPLGPTGRQINGITRYQPGYIAYAGAANNSRGTQLIIANANNLFLGGGCPWEVPFGQIIGESSYKVLNSIYSGYKEKISQRLINKDGMEYLKQFHDLDYLTSCKIVASDLPYRYQSHVNLRT